MKMNHLLVAAAVALVPATASLANPALEAKKAKMKAMEEAKEKAKKEIEEKAAAAKAAATAKAADKAAAADESKKAEEEAHQKNVGLIERLEQIATATNNAELKAKVDGLKAKEEKRHTLATGG